MDGDTKSLTTIEKTASPTFGYFAAVEDERHGHIGGLLTICDRGRPLEFHCTAPLLPSHAQEILYGATLRACVLGESLKRALLDQAKLPITLLLVNDPAAQDATRESGPPTVLISTERGWSDGLAGAPRDWLDRLAASIDPEEPFERVYEAIREAQRLMIGEDESEAPHRDAA